MQVPGYSAAHCPRIALVLVWGRFEWRRFNSCSSLSVFISRHPSSKFFYVLDAIQHGQSTASRHFIAAHSDSLVPIPRSNVVCI